LQGNQITSIGDGFELSLHLKRLFLGLNAITELSGVSHLSHLEVLDLSDNKIAELPTSFRKVLPESLRIFDVKNNPATLEGSDHRAAVAKALPKLALLDGSRITDADRDCEARGRSKMFISVPLEEDDGVEAPPAKLEFDKGDDLWSVADTFCGVHDIEGVLARRQLVNWMKGEAVMVYGVTITDKKVTKQKLEETKGMEEDEEEEEEETKAMEEEKSSMEEEKEETAAGTASFHIADRSQAVQYETNRAMDAVSSFMASFDTDYSVASTSLKSASSKVHEKTQERVEKQEDVSDEAVSEAKEMLAKRIERIKKEKLAALRKKREFLEEQDDARKKMIEGADEQLKLLKEMNEMNEGETKEELMGDDESSDEEGNDEVNQAFEERMKKLGASDLGRLDEEEDERYFDDGLKENYENHVLENRK